ncbi:hypothetical protein C0995_015434 [Termitomyces sp. Mi166|nr:hypothetical protein C0995_015434 [Termitomyces sp. Mi166\
MPSLSSIPHNVLQDIAFDLAILSLPRPPLHLASLLLACSDTYRALSPRNCPQLYARIFRETFDFDPNLHAKVSDSVLASELHRRHRVLWRTRCMDLSSDFDQEELCGAMRMVIENAGQNEKLLSSAGFSTFMMSFVLQRLMHAGAANLLPLTDDNTTSMEIWLLCLSLNHQDIVNTPEETRQALLRLLRFPTAYRASRQQSSDAFFVGVEIFQRPPGPVDFLIDIGRDSLLEKATPIIILIFALNEVVPITIPAHVPETRAIAIASQRSGPTVEDFRAIFGGRTPLFAETKMTQDTGTNPAAIMSNPAHLQLYKSRINNFLYSTYIDPRFKPGYVYVPGFLSGVWEGSFMISGEPAPTSPLIPPMLGQFSCLKPMQCAITEYLCFSPYVPIPFSYSLDLVESAVKSSGFGYEKYTADEGISAQRLPSEALDVILLGETLPDHERAFGGFKFSGRIRADGYMIMCREPKNHEDREGLGTWIFEGHLRYGVALVGQWRASSIDLAIEKK